MNKYYVYELIDPRDLKVFYVGKGKDKRMYTHVSSVKCGVVPHKNRHLFYKIKQILNEGYNVIYKQIFFTDDNDEAYKREIERIKEIGIENLCNLIYSSPRSEESYKEFGEKMMGHITTEKTKQKISQSLKGHFMSEETKQKISNTKKGKKRPCSDLQRKRIIEAYTPEGGWKDLISPSGERVPVYCILDTAKKYGLNPPSITELYQGKHSHHRGWKVASQ
jgi:hypothetical protein